MFRRKLLALEYHNPNNFNIDDEKEFRNLIVWLENHKIRHYKIEDRESLNKICSGDWKETFNMYLKDLGFVLDFSDKNVVLDWILGYAVRLEYGDSVEKYRNVSKVAKVKQGQSDNPLDNLDFDSPDFKAGVVSLAQLLHIGEHPDHRERLKAISLLVREKFSAAAIEEAKKHKNDVDPSLPLDKMELGFQSGDSVCDDAAKILRLIHIKELRDLQNSANEAIVTVQKLTANPKTDTKLGKVGRN